MVRPALLAAALLLAGCGAKPSSPVFLPQVDPPVTSLARIAPREVALVAMFNNNCPVPYDDGEGDVIVTSCGRASMATHCPLRGSDARFVVAAMRGLIPGGAEHRIGRRFYLVVQLGNGRMFTATIPSEGHVGGDRATILVSGGAGTISAAHLSRLQAIARRAGCLNPPPRPGSAT